MNFDPNPLCFQMLNIYAENQRVNKDIRLRVKIRNEGSTRSSKTWDYFHTLYAILAANPNKGLETYIYRDTLTNCRDFTLKEFVKCLRVIGVYNPDLLKATGQKPEYNINGNPIYFRGMEDDIEYPPSDFIFHNEVLEINRPAYENSVKRCRIMEVSDWNPKFTDHWIFDTEGQPNTWFTRTTYKNNKHLDYSIIAEIESKSPWIIDDMALPEDERRPHLVNIKNGTADKFQWLVYGCGIRYAMEGLIFDQCNYVSCLPTEYESRYFGIDFGKTTGTYTLTDSVMTRKDGRKQLYYDCPIYAKFDTNRDFYEAIKAYYQTSYKGVKWNVFCDIAEPQKINDLNVWAQSDELSATFIGARKWEGCVNWRIDLIKSNGINLVPRPWIRKEQENYFWMTVNGIKLNVPLKNGFDHFWDAAGMSIQYDTELRS